MDALYFYRYSKFSDDEIRYSLRSVEQHWPTVGKVWIFGDRPGFLTDDRTLAEHVPHGYLARVGGFRTPVTNFFLMFYLSSMIPELHPEYLWFCDDFLLLDDLSDDDAKTARNLPDLGKVKNRGRGLWKDSLWRTYDLLKRLGYSTYNFETHTPTFHTKKRVLEAYCAFKDFVTEDRWFGMLGPTAILNHAYKRDNFDLVPLAEENSLAGFHHQPAKYSDIVADCEGKRFLNFDDDAYGDGMRRFLAERFPTPSRYERPAAGVVNSRVQGQELFGSVTTLDTSLQANTGKVATTTATKGSYPRVVMRSRDEFGRFLSEHGLLGEGVEVGTLRGEFAAQLLGQWPGRLHCVDPWQQATEDVAYQDVNNVSQAEHDRNFEIAMRRLSSFEHRCIVHRMTSQQAAERFSDRTLDFVYLDARHYRDAVLEDLQLWNSKVRIGGFLCGHDYLDGTLPSGTFQVKCAVDAWAAERQLEVVCSGEHVWRSWFIQIT